VYQCPLTLLKECLLYSVPLGTIARVKESKKKGELLVLCKHGRRLIITVPSKVVKQEALDAIQRYAFPSSVHQLFAFLNHGFDDGIQEVNFHLEDGKNMASVGAMTDITKTTNVLDWTSAIAFASWTTALTSSAQPTHLAL
jgi:hypothetical protein